MRYWVRGCLILSTVLFAGAAGSSKESQPLPVRGLHVAAPKPGDMPECLRFIREALPKEGVNLLVVEFNYGYLYSKRPEVVENDALSPDDVASIVAACRDAGVRLIPMINMLGHQSWAGTTFGLLRAHPEFDETLGKYPDNKDIYCRSYCPLHPDVHAVLFDLIDEMLDACGADAFHAGMDEVFLLGEDDCQRCRGKNKAELFAGEVKVLRDHLAKSGRTLWIWGDRLLDGEVTGLGNWEAAINGAEPAIRMIPKDVVICDWHYEAAVPTAMGLDGRNADLYLHGLLADDGYVIRQIQGEARGDILPGILQIEGLCIHDAGQRIDKRRIRGGNCNDRWEHGNVFKAVAGCLLSIHDNLNSQIAVATLLADGNVHLHRLRIECEASQDFSFRICDLDRDRLVHKAFTDPFETDCNARPNRLIHQGFWP